MPHFMRRQLFNQLVRIALFTTTMLASCHPSEETVNVAGSFHLLKWTEGSKRFYLVEGCGPLNGAGHVDGTVQYIGVSGDSVIVVGRKALTNNARLEWALVYIGSGSVKYFPGIPKQEFFNQQRIDSSIIVPASKYWRSKKPNEQVVPHGVEL